MPLFYSHHIDDNTRLAIWHITEPQDFFLEKVPLSRAITHEHKRLQHLAGRYLLQYLFADFPLALIQVATTRKPYLPEESHHFSISHCGDYAAAIASTTKRVGIDIEKPVEKLSLLAHKFLNEHEQQLLQTYDDERLQILTLLWSAKESMFKWYSLGGIDFRQHLLAKKIQARGKNEGELKAAFNKLDQIEMTIPFRFLDDIVLSWIAQ